MPRRVPGSEATLVAGGVMLALAWACVRPRMDPWATQVSAAQAQYAASLPESGREAYVAGFRDGAAMVDQARKANLRPYRPVVGQAQAPMAWRSFLPEGAQAEPSDPIPEVDEETGLLAFPASGARGVAFAQGQADGFTWALRAVGSTLLRPTAPPDPPKAWSSWRTRSEGLVLNDGDHTVRLFWSPGRLSWSWLERGFPAQRNWRVWGAAEEPAWAGLSGRTAWIELKQGKAVVLDLATGGILRVVPAVPHPEPPEMDDQQRLEADAAAWRDPKYQAELRRLEAAAASGRLPDLLAVVEHLRGMGPEADRRAFPWQLRCAEAGDPRSMLQVGVAYFHGVVVTADRSKAASWLDRAAQAGAPQAAEVKAMLLPASK